MHGRVIGGDDHQAALHAGDARVHEGIGTDVHAHMLHAHQRPFPGIRHAQGRLHGRFLVRAPTAPHPALPRKGVALDIFRDFGGRRPRIGIHPGQPGMQRPQGKRLVPQQQSFTSHGSNTSKLITTQIYSFPAKLPHPRRVFSRPAIPQDPTGLPKGLLCPTRNSQSIGISVLCVPAAHWHALRYDFASRSIMMCPARPPGPHHDALRMLGCEKSSDNGRDRCKKGGFGLSLFVSSHKRRWIRR